MATVHSLVCWGGRTGKTVTLSIASPCVVTSTNHGLRDGTGLVFETTGALPTGLVAGTTYYAKSTALGTFNLYSDAALTNIINTSGSQSGTHVAKSTRMLEYFALYAGRWGDSDNERCFDSLASWNAARTGVASDLDEEVCEIGEAFTEYSASASSLSVAISAAKVRIESKINGVRTEAFHNGLVSTPADKYGFVIELQNRSSLTTESHLT